jgi:hypothetical protein
MDFKETLQECSRMCRDARDVHKSRDIYFTHGFRGIILGVFRCVWRCAQVWRFYSGHGIQRKHSRSVPMCPEMCTSPEYFTPDMYSGGITPDVFQHVQRCAQVQRVGLWTCASEESLQECSSVSGDAYKSGVFYSGHGLQGNTPGVFQHVQRCAQVRRFYSGHGIHREHSRSVPMCPEMCTSPECFIPDMEFRGNTPGVFQCVQRCVQVRSILLRTCTLEESLQMFSNMSRGVPKSRELYSGHMLLRNHCRSVLVFPEMCTSPECFTPDMEFRGNTPGVFQHVQRCAQVRRYLLHTGFRGIILGVFQCVWRCAQVRRFYSGHGIQRKHSRSVPMCPEMCTSPEYFTPDMYSGGITPDVFQHVQRCAQVQRVGLWTCASEESLQECSSVSRDAYKSGVFYSGHGLQGNTPGVFQHVQRYAQVRRYLLHTGLRGIILGVFQCVWKCAQVRRFYSGHGI